jgi:hypothetical protein
VLITQYCYFNLVSEQMTAAEMTARLRVEPDEVQVRAGREAQPPRPATHRWMVVCRQAGLRVDEQIERIVRRLYEHAGAIGDLAAELDRIEGGPGSSVLQIVRVFGDPTGEDEDVCEVDGLRKLPGQHQLLGWHLDNRALEFLRMTHAQLDVDEYAHS